MGLFDTTRNLASLWAQAKSAKYKRKLQGIPDTAVDSGGSINSYDFDGQEITRDELREIKNIRESGGVVSFLVHAKALMMFGTGIEFEVEDNESSTVEMDGEEITLKEYLESTFGDLSHLLLSVGEDALWYPYGAVELVETRGGDFSHVEPVEPWTILPMTNKKGNIVKWEQEISRGEARRFGADEIVHFPLNKSSARDKTGISSVLRSKEEIQQFRENQQAIQSAIELHGFPQRHVKVGREGGAPIKDNELRRIRNLFDGQSVDSDTVFVTGQDVDIEALEAENFDFEKVSENDIRQLALALGVPFELTGYGSDGLGSGMPADVRLSLFKLQIKANQRHYTSIWRDDVIRTVLRDYTPFNHRRNFEINLRDPITSQEDMASLISSVGEYMTTAEVRSKLDLEKPEDDEIAESYRKPSDIEAPEESQDDEPLGGLFNADRQLAQIPDKYTNGTGLSESDFVPNSDVESVVDDVLEYIDVEGLPNPENQREGAARANQLKDHAANDDPLAVDFWEEIYNFHKRHRAQGNHECDESSLPEEAEKSDFDSCYWDPGYFSDKTWGGDAGFEQAERIVTTLEDNDIELAGDMDFSEYPDWESHLLEMHQRIHEDTATRLLDIPSGGQTPEFVKERIKDAIRGGAVFADIEAVSSDDMFQLREFMTETLTSDGWTIDGLSNQLEQLDIPADKAQTIARTETAAIVNSAREDGYQEQYGDDAKFYWTGAYDDGRTTEACQWLMDQTHPEHGGTPVELKELQDLIEEAPRHDSEMQDDLARPDSYTVHPNERKTFVRHVDGTFD